MAAALLLTAIPHRPGRGALPPRPALIRIIRMPGGLRFGLIGNGQTIQPRPYSFLRPWPRDDGGRNQSYTEVARLLLEHGILSVVIDPPAHGEDVRPGEPANAMAKTWRRWLENGEDFVGAFTANAKQTLDYLVKEGYTDPRRVAACGISRAGRIPGLPFRGGRSPSQSRRRNFAPDRSARACGNGAGNDACGCRRQSYPTILLAPKPGRPSGLGSASAAISDQRASTRTWPMQLHPGGG